MKNSRTAIKNKLPNLLSALTKHKDCPEWLVDAIWDAFNNNAGYVSNSPVYWAAQLEAVEITQKIRPSLNSEVVQ